MDLIVTAKAVVATDTVRVQLRAQGGTDLPVAAPGGHLPVTLPDGTARRYSLTALGPEAYEITVLRADPSGGGSTYIHDRLAVGDTVATEPAEDGFPLAPGAHHGVFIAGGIGITPFLTLIPTLRAAGGTHALHYAARDEGRMLNLPSGLDATRHTDDGTHSPLDLAALLDATDREAHLYVCGPRGLIEAVRQGATERGWPPTHIHFESFGAAPRRGDRPVTVKLLQTGNTITVEPGTTILDALLAEGVWASHLCRRGTCGHCFTPVAHGAPDHRDLCLTPPQRAQGMCTCISWAMSDTLVLDL